MTEEKRGGIVWLDGSKDPAPPGALLTDNLEFFGDTIYTGAAYTCLTPTVGPADTPEDLPELAGRRLQDGRLIRRFRKEPVTSVGRLVTAWDFRQTCTFTEIDLYLGRPAAEVTVSCTDGEAPQLLARGGARDGGLYRLPLAGQRAQHLTVEVTAADGGAVELYQVWAFGDAERRQQRGDFSVDRFVYANSIAMQSLMGAPNTAFSDVEGFHWMKRMRRAGLSAAGAVWSEQPAFGDLALRPILPTPQQVAAPVSRRLCRGGSESVCLAVTNTDTTAPRDVRVTVDAPPGLSVRRAFVGVMASRWYGMAAGPLFDEEHTLARERLFRYVENAAVLCDLPLLHLPAGGSCLVWLHIACPADTAPGEYALRVLAEADGAPVPAEKNVQIAVLPHTLPAVHTATVVWGEETTMYPFTYADRPLREAEYRRDLGINVYGGWPEPGTVQRAALENDPRAQFMLYRLGSYGDRIYTNEFKAEDITPQVERDVAQILADNVRTAERLGLDFDQWFLAMPDEPGLHNIRALRAFVELCKRIEPRIRIYANPAFWAGFEHDGVAADEDVAAALDGWYDRLIDISVPLFLNLEDRPLSLRYFRTGREFNGQYAVSGQHMNADRADLVSLARTCAWDSLARDMDLWGFYSYYCPRLDSWDNTVRPQENVDGTINYQCVYGGMYGPIPTRASEAQRAGYEDHRLMALLREHAPSVHRRLKEMYLAGEAAPEALRSMALDALTAPPEEVAR